MASNDTHDGLRAGIDVRVAALSAALSDGDATAPVGDDRIGTTLRLSQDGPRATRSTMVGPDDRDRTIEVLPRLADGTAGPSARDRAGFELGATTLFAEALDRWRDGVTDAVSAFDAHDADAGRRALDRPVVQVPGGYDDADRADVARALRASGVDPLDTVPAPLATAAAHVPALAERTVLTVVDVGDHWCNVAVVDVDPSGPSYRVLAQSGTPGLGRRAMDTATAEWAFDRAAERYNTDIEYGPAAFARVRDAASEALEAVSPETDPDIAVPEVTDVSLGAGTGPIAVETTLDIADAYDLLDDVTDRIVEELKRALATAAVDRGDIDAVVVAGRGTAPLPVRRAIEGFLEHRVETPSRGDRTTAPARGAALLATQYDGGTAPIERDPLARELGITIPTEAGPVFEPVVPATATTGETYRIDLQTTVDNQTHGYLQVASRHAVTGAVETVNTYSVTRIPPREAGEMRVRVEMTPRSESEGGVDTSATIAPDAIEGGIDQSLTVSAVPASTADEPWLARVDDDPDAVVSREAASADGRAAAMDPTDAAFEDLSPERAIDRLIDVRYNLWKSLQTADEELASTLEGLLKQFDSGLRRIGVEPIEPDPGDPKDLGEHRVWGTEPSDHPDDTVLRVRRPGYLIDDRVVDPADVVISQGTPDSADGDEGDSSPADEGTTDAADGTRETDAGDADDESTAGDGEDAADGADETGDADAPAEVRPAIPDAEADAGAGDDADDANGGDDADDPDDGDGTGDPDDR
ncbi:MAG: nucleotide exchange factor GrpE [Haloplanus sp.]